MNRKPKEQKEASEGIHEAANRKRDNIIRNVHNKRTETGATLNQTDLTAAQVKFEHYLDQHKKKRTPERLIVLKKVYECQAPVDIQTLHELVCNEEYAVSLTTIYNNLSLLVDAGLVRKLDLVGGKMAFFEKTLGVKPHGYVICDECGGISLIRSLDISSQRVPAGFRVQDVTFHIHGVCKKCQSAERKRNSRKLREAEQKLNEERDKRIRKRQSGVKRQKPNPKQ